MRIDGNGQAKILTLEEISDFFTYGCESHRDKALFGLCLYTGCRISEARQMLYEDIFCGEEVRDEIMIRKCHSKGKIGTRSIPTHPDLASLLKNYYRESLELNGIKDKYGSWGPLSKGITSRAKCPICQSVQTKKKGLVRNKQRYQCKQCKSYFREPDQPEDYVMRQIDVKHCPGCQSDHIIKNGTRDGQQNYLCKNCKRQFQEFYATRWHSFKAASNSPIEVVEIENGTVKYPGIKDISNYGLLFSTPDNPYLFPGYKGRGCLSKDQCLAIFERACERIGLEGAGTHSFRRTTLTQLHNLGFPLRVIQKISGHQDLNSLQSYLEVQDEQVHAAVQLLR